MDILTADIPLPEKVTAFFTARQGGVSDPPYHSFNLSINVGDDADAVYENRIRLAEKLPAEPMWLRQAHGSRVMRADEVTRDGDVADAMVTDSAGVVCAVQTADCLPVLFYSEDGGAVGAAHAGWRGLAAGVLENTVAAMQNMADGALYACIGPAISAEHYVASKEVLQALQVDDGDEQIARACDDDAEKWYIDLPALAARRLHLAGVAGVHNMQLCTYANAQLLFSARRDRHNTGRQAGIIYFSA